MGKSAKPISDLPVMTCLSSFDILAFALGCFEFQIMGCTNNSQPMVRNKSLRFAGGVFLFSGSSDPKYLNIVVAAP